MPRYCALSREICPSAESSLSAAVNISQSGSPLRKATQNSSWLSSAIILNRMVSREPQPVKSRKHSAAHSTNARNLRSFFISSTLPNKKIRRFTWIM